MVAPLAIGWRYFLPLLFWGVHVGIDELQKATLEQSAVIESAVLIGACSGVFYVQYSRWAALTPGGSLAGYMAHIRSRANAVLHLD